MLKKFIFCLGLILTIAFFFRFWKLDKIPPGFYPDEAINANEAFFSLKNKNFRVFYPENYGREGLFIWLIAFSFFIFKKISIFTVKIVPATIGFLTVIGLYLLTKEIFKESKYLSLFAAFFLATSFWHTNFSRIAFRGILLPFILVFSFYFLLKSFSKKSLLNSILAGIFFGLGFFTYTSFRMAVLILPFLLLPLWLLSKKEGIEKRFISLTFAFLLSTFLVALPIGIYFLNNPQHFISRAAPITIFKAKNPAKEFFKSLTLHLLMFNFYGDPNWRHNFSKKPELVLPVGILFLIGIFLSFKECLNSTKKRNWKNALKYWLLFSWWFVMLLPGILTREGIPHSLRVIGALPPVFIFAAIGAEKIYSFLVKKIKNEKIVNFAFLIFLFICAFLEFQKYFLIWAEKPEVKSEFAQDLVKMGNYLNSLPENFEKYVIVNKEGVPVSWARNIPMPAQTIMFLEISKYGKIVSKYILPEDIEKTKIEKNAVFLPLLFDGKIFKILKEKYPEGKMKKMDKFFVYEID